jgi:hypothetical protein
MMFMMPIPPTSKDTAATLRGVGGLLLGSSKVRQVAHGEIVELTIRLAMLLAEDADHLRLRVRHLVGRDGRDQNAADVNAVLAHHAGFVGHPGHYHQIVLILALRGLSLAYENADHLARHRLHAHDLAQRLAGAEELRRHCLPNHADLGAGVGLAAVEEAPTRD